MLSSLPVCIHRLLSALLSFLPILTLSGSTIATYLLLMFLLAATTLFPTSLRHTSSPVYHYASRTLLLSLDSFSVPISILWALQPTKRLSPAVLTITVSVLTQLLGALKNFPGPMGALSELLV